MATTTMQSTASATAGRSVRRVRATAVGAAVAANVALYLAASAAGTDFLLTDPGKDQSHHLIVPEIAAFTLLFALLGWGTMALLERFTRHARTVWSVLAAAVLALSFVPLGLEQASPATRAALAVIHIVVAVALLPLVRRPAGR
ncbi:hypothetical protein SAMN05443665_1001548 [Actinomadura meyerae]|jgi:hypothetical protein|uniref:Uncharacterized protein n=1 Tax=Actinomadura meyerae TaxID=240840 RepID=A0A239CRA6_9ACTN|nr:DUF6069 family protein [Actinomadura meyerae]SNS22181.1 hypothetical protein SAMN05443665_1001548 [Actinomadura meyerae]